MHVGGNGDSPSGVPAAAAVAVVCLALVVGTSAVAGGSTARTDPAVATAGPGVDGFEDGDLSEYDDVEAATTTTDTVYSGDRALVLTDRNNDGFVQNGHRTGEVINRSFPSATPDTLHAALRIDDGTYNDVKIRWYNESGGVAHAIDLSSYRSEMYYGGKSGVTLTDIEPYTWYHVELRGIDYEANRVGEILVDGRQVATDVEFNSPADGITAVEMEVNDGGTGSQGWYDEVSVPGAASGGDATPTPTASSESATPERGGDGGGGGTASPTPTATAPQPTTTAPDDVDDDTPSGTPTPEGGPDGEATATATATGAPTGTSDGGSAADEDADANAGTVGGADGGGGEPALDDGDGGQALTLPGGVPLVPASGATLVGLVALAALARRVRGGSGDSSGDGAAAAPPGDDGGSDGGHGRDDGDGTTSTATGATASGSVGTTAGSDTTAAGTTATTDSAGPGGPAGVTGSTRAGGSDARWIDRGDLSGRPESVPTTPDLDLSYDDLDRGDRIGTGGNADVYYATAPGLDGPVDLAVKEPRMEGTLHAETVERILGEAETWDQLDGHAGIVSVVDYGSEPFPWIAMEYMDAGHLGDRLAAEPTLVERLWVGYAVVKAVRHAHQHGVAHLDLKPENVLFRSTGEDTWPVPKVADWGLSKHLLNHSNSIEGLTPAYAAPEQFDDDLGPTDDITDVYQLGAVLYELFTGQPPFEGPPAQVMHEILHEEPAPPSDHVQVPPAVDEMVMRALATDRDERYDSVLYLRDDLREIVQSL